MNLTTTTCIIILVHISIFVIFIIIRKIQKLEKLKLFLIKVINILTFGFYLGFYMEVYILFLLVDFSEISYQLRYGIQNTQSTVTSYIIVSAMLMMFLLTAWQWCKSRNEDSFSKQKYFRAVVEGMKPKWICRSYHLVFLIRRTLFGVIIFFVPFDMMMLRVCLFAGVQGLLLLYILFLRPQEGIKENLIDVINEILYFYFAAFLVYYNSEEKWNSTTTDVYFWILITNNFILIFIMLVSLIFTLISLIRKLIQKLNNLKIKSKNQTSVQPINRMRTIMNGLSNSTEYRNGMPNGNKV